MTLSRFGYALDFDSPGYLWLLLVIPVLWFAGRHSLSALGGWRRWMAFLLRAAVVLAMVLALADAQIVRSTDRLAVIYLLDRSLSVSPTQAKEAIEFINRSRAEQRDRKRGDLAGVIVFGRQAAVELPPLAEDAPLLQIETQVDADFTDLGSGLRLARACFPPYCAKRLVILSDGNENLESALEEARAMATDEIGIDVVPLSHPLRGDVAVEKVTMPAEVRRATPFEVRAVLNHASDASAEGDQKVRGTVRVIRRGAEEERTVAEQEIEIEPGRRVFAFREQIDSPDFYTYDVQFIPADAAADGLAQNNRATAFTQVRGQGRILLIEDSDHVGEHQHFVDRLRNARLEVDVAPSSNAFANLADLQRYDSVILANVPRTSGDGAEIRQFSDDQIDGLVKNTQQLGCGLVMLGGPASFGAGGWNNTPLERAMPVDFQVKNVKAVPQGALMLVIDSSGSMSGDKIDMSKAAAIAAVRVMGERDFVGVVTFDSAATTLVPMQRVGNGARIAAKISPLGAGGGTNMMPGMELGYNALNKVDSAVKHMIVLTDGQTEGIGFERLAAQMRRRNITTTAVAIGADSAGGLMMQIASAGGGKFYQVDNPRAIPRIFMKEAMRVARPLVYENPAGVPPAIHYPHEMLRGIEQLPPVTGYVLTTPKSNPLVEVSLAAPLPSPGPYPLLSSWTYGLGRSVALTTDVGQRWATSWGAWENYDKLFTQIVRWSMRPTTGDSRFAMSAEARDGQLQIVINALDQDENYLNFLAPQGTVIDPSMQSVELKVEQVAPGRYVATAPAEKPGNYFVTVIPGPDVAPLRTGVNVSYSAEFRQVDENRALLMTLAEQAPAAGVAGEVIELTPAVLTPEGSPSGLPNVFRRDLPKPTARQACWHLLLLAAAILFFVDVFNRRVALSPTALLAQAGAYLTRYWRRPAPVTASSEVIDRLRKRKEEVGEQLDGLRTAARWEQTSASPSPLDDVIMPAGAAKPVAAPAPPTLAAEKEEESYTSRLLKAKRQVRRQIDGDSGENRS